MGGACIANAIDMIHAVDRWYAQQFAYLVGRLDSITEGDRTLLDNSATVWFNEMSDGNAHNLNNMPILQAGSCGGYFKTGWAVNVEGGKADMTPGHSDEDCSNGQSPPTGGAANLDSVGTPPDVATQPINKYYCNLMNAIGVKAGPDGHPLKGGTAPVSKFGKYDDTTLFRTDDARDHQEPGRVHGASRDVAAPRPSARDWAWIQDRPVHFSWRVLTCSRTYKAAKSAACGW